MRLPFSGGLWYAGLTEDGEGGSCVSYFAKATKDRLFLTARPQSISAVRACGAALVWRAEVEGVLRDALPWRGVLASGRYIAKEGWKRP